LFLVHLFLAPVCRSRLFPPKRLFLQKPRGVTQKTPFFIVTAVKTWSLTIMKLFVKLNMQINHTCTLYYLILQTLRNLTAALQLTVAGGEKSVVCNRVPVLRLLVPLPIGDSDRLTSVHLKQSGHQSYERLSNCLIRRTLQLRGLTLLGLKPEWCITSTQLQQGTWQPWRHLFKNARNPKMHVPKWPPLIQSASAFYDIQW
jgi:hypothetical protein